MNHREGFTLIEVLIAAFLLSVAAVAVTGLIVLSTRLAFESERSAVAQGIVNQSIEYIRSLDYNDVRIDESSELLPSQIVVANGQEYELLLAVELKDDPANGLLASLDHTNADYKQVYVTAQWETVGQSERSVKSSTIITRLSNPISCTPGNISCPGPGGSNTVQCPTSGYCPALQYCAVGEYQCFGGTVLCPASGICPGSPPGLGGSCPAEAYFCSTTSDQGLVLSEFFPDPAGADDTGEFIEIENPQDDSVDISGWKIDDGPGGSAPYVIPPGTTIDPGEFVTFDQTETGIELDNDEDSVRIFDEYWNEVVEVSYVDPVEGQSYTQIDDAGSGDGGAGGAGGAGGGTGGGSYVWYPPTPGLPGPVWCPTSDDYQGSDDYC